MRAPASFFCFPARAASPAFVFPSLLPRLQAADLAQHSAWPAGGSVVGRRYACRDALQTLPPTLMPLLARRLHGLCEGPHRALLVRAFAGAKVRAPIYESPI